MISFEHIKCRSKESFHSYLLVYRSGWMGGLAVLTCTMYMEKLYTTRNQSDKPTLGPWDRIGYVKYNRRNEKGNRSSVSMREYIYIYRHYFIPTILTTECTHILYTRMWYVVSAARFDACHLSWKHCRCHICSYKQQINRRVGYIKLQNRKKPSITHTPEECIHLRTPLVRFQA